MRYQIEFYAVDAAVLNAVVPPREIVGARISNEINGTYGLELQIRLPSDAYDELVTRGQVWVRDTETSGSTPRKFRLLSKRIERQGDGALVGKLVCEHITNDLSTLVTRTQRIYSGITPDEALELILDGSGFTAGTVDTNVGSMVSEFSIGGPKLGDLRNLAEAVNAILVVNDDKSVDLLEYPDLTTPDLYVHPRAGLLDNAYWEDVGNYVSRMFAFGGGDPAMTLGGAWHVTWQPPINVTGTVYRCYGRHIAHGEDALTGGGRTYYVEFTKDGTGASRLGELFPISSFSDWVLGVQHFDFDAGGVFNGAQYQMFRLWYDDGSGPQLLDFVPHADAYNELGGDVDGAITEGDLELVENVMVGPFTGSTSDFSKTGTSGGGILCDVDPTLAGDSVNVINGTSSVKVTTTAPGCGVYRRFDMGLMGHDALHWSAKVLVYLTSGRITAEVVEGDWSPGFGTASRGTVFPDYATTPANRVDISTPGWHTITFEGFTNERGNDGAVLIYQLGDNDSVFTVDSINVYPSANVPEIWVESSTRTNMWKRAWAELGLRGREFVNVEATLADLNALDPDRYDHLAFAMRSVVQIQDEETGVDVAAFVAAMEENLLNPLDTTVRLSRSRSTVEGERAALLDEQVRRLSSKVRQLRDYAHPMKRAGVLSPNSATADKTMAQIAGGPGNSHVALVAYAGPAFHRMPFMSRLVVPEGYRAVWFFQPTTTLENLSGAPYFARQQSQRAFATTNFLSGGIFREAGVGLVSSGGTAVGHLKYFVTTNEASTKVTGNRPIADVESAFENWVPPGEYLEPVLCAVGDTGSLSSCQAYGGMLLILLVPLSAVSLGSGVGSTSLVDATSVTFDTGGVYPPSSVQYGGKFRIGLGGKDEEVLMDGPSGSPPSPDSRSLLSNAATTAGRRRGEVVQEVRYGLAEYPTHECSPGRRTRVVVTPTVTYA